MEGFVIEGRVVGLALLQTVVLAFMKEANYRLKILSFTRKHCRRVTPLLRRGDGGEVSSPASPARSY